MGRAISVLIGSTLVLAACGGGGGGGEPSASYDRAAVPPSAPKMMVEESAAFDAPIVEGEYDGSGAAQPEPDAPVQQIAYTHRYELRYPRGSVEAALTGHVTSCQKAGPSRCIVAESSVNSENEDYTWGRVSIWASPDWIETFNNGIDQETESAGGEIVSRNMSAEDLTRRITDTAARLEAQKVLRQRLTGLLANRDGELGELLQVERELARVTGDIESIETQLKSLRLRVSMSELHLEYATIVPPFSTSRDNPLGEAFSDFFYNLSGAIAAVITAFAIGLPWILLIGLFLWIWLKLIWPRLRKRRS